jgi:hypothetical protein
MDVAGKEDIRSKALDEPDLESFVAGHCRHLILTASILALGEASWRVTQARVLNWQLLSPRNFIKPLFARANQMKKSRHEQVAPGCA